MASTLAHRRTLRAALSLVPIAALAACSLPSTDAPAAPSTSASAGPSSGAPGTVTLVTHDSFALADGLLEDFTASTGITVEVVQPGDAGTLVNQLVLTKDAPLGDAVFGIDNAFASRALDEGVLAPYEELSK